MLGEIALYSFVILLLTGVFLTFFYIPSVGPVVYDGLLRPAVGQNVSEAYASTVRLSFDVRGGLLMRQIHHWAALIFVAAIVVHMFRVFFTGAFRKPREINWVIGSILALLAIFEGFAGYSLPDDLLSGHRPADRRRDHPGRPGRGHLHQLLPLRRPVPRRGCSSRGSTPSTCCCCRGSSWR